MEVPGLALLARSSPEAAARLEEFVRRLVGSLDADRWAADQVRTLVEAHAQGDLLGGLVAIIRDEAGTGEAWGVLWTGDPVEGTASFSALAGQGQAPPHPEAMSRTLLAAVATGARPVWLDDRAAGPLEAAASIVASDVRPHGAVPLGSHGAVYLAGSGEPRGIRIRSRLRIEALCRIASGFIEAAPERHASASVIPGMIGGARPMRELARTLQGFAVVPWPVLVLGETGTGKELVARALHDLSPRAAGPFVPVNCAAIPEELAESTLFGHERGAFTGADRRRQGLVERANGGTLFLDEVGELSGRAQAKLLRLLQEGRFEPVGGDQERPFTGRIIAATLRAIAPGEGGFRADLYHRLGACVVRVPPLRERRADIRALATHLVSRALRELPGSARVNLSDAALEALEARDWPGNVRELDNVLKAALAQAVAHGVRTLEPSHLGMHDAAASSGAHGGPQGARSPSWALAAREPRALVRDREPPPGADAERFYLVGANHSEPLPDALQLAVERVQRALVRAALDRAGGNRPQAATRLGVSRQWLHTLLTRWAERDGGDVG